MNVHSKSNRTIIHIGVILVLVACGIAMSVFVGSRFNFFPQLISHATAATTHQKFPEIDQSDLSSLQRNIIKITKREYDEQPEGTKYSQGANEAWCANFISWVMKEAGVPFTNPDSGSWRIPGTYTLRDYYESTGRFRAVGTGHAPKIGDVMLYDNPSTFGQHANIVIKNENGIVTTIGGNEPGGIRVYVHKQREATGFVGYGVLTE